MTEIIRSTPETVGLAENRSNRHDNYVVAEAPSFGEENTDARVSTMASAVAETRGGTKKIEKKEKLGKRISNSVNSALEFILPKLWMTIKIGFFAYFAGAIAGGYLAGTAFAGIGGLISSIGLGFMMVGIAPFIPFIQAALFVGIAGAMVGMAMWAVAIPLIASYKLIKAGEFPKHPKNRERINRRKEDKYRWKLSVVEYKQRKVAPKLEKIYKKEEEKLKKKISKAKKEKRRNRLEEKLRIVKSKRSTNAKYL